MSICPLCNGFEEITIKCNCGGSMVDSGKEMDFYDDYSAYMPIDQMKLEDGYPNSLRDQKCPHLFTCLTCASDTVVFIDE